jgi:hypothetical protein
LPALLCIFECAFAASAPAGAQPAPSSGYHSRLSSEIALGAYLRNRLDLEVGTAVGLLSLFVVDIESSAPRRTDFGIVSPYLSLGPCTLDGLLGRLANPRLVPASEGVRESGVRIDRSFEGGSLHGIFLAVPETPALPLSACLFLTGKGPLFGEAAVPAPSPGSPLDSGTAGGGEESPWSGSENSGSATSIFDRLDAAEQEESEQGQRSAGAMVAVASPLGFRVEAAVQSLGFAAPESSDEWLTRSPLFAGGEVTYAGGGIGYSLPWLSVWGEGAICTSPILPLSEAFGADLRLRGKGGAVRDLPAGRGELCLQAAHIAPNYLTRFGRFASAAELGRLRGELAVGGLSLTGQYEVEIGRLSCLPTPYRRVVQCGEGAVELALGGLTIGVGGRRRSESDEEGRTELSGAALFGLELEGKHSSLRFEAERRAETGPPSWNAAVVAALTNLELSASFEAAVDNGASSVWSSHGQGGNDRVPSGVRRSPVRQARSGRRASLRHPLPNGRDANQLAGGDSLTGGQSPTGMTSRSRSKPSSSFTRPAT